MEVSHMMDKQPYDRSGALEKQWTLKYQVKHAKKRDGTKKKKESQCFLNNSENWVAFNK